MSAGGAVVDVIVLAGTIVSRQPSTVQECWRCRSASLYSQRAEVDLSPRTQGIYISTYGQNTSHAGSSAGEDTNEVQN